MNRRARSKQNFVLCPLTNVFGILQGEVRVYHKTLSFLSLAVFHTHSFSGCKLCVKHFCSPVLAPLLALSYSAPQSLTPVSHISCMAQFSVSWWEWDLLAVVFLTMSGPFLSIHELPGLACKCVWLLSCSPGHTYRAFLCLAQSRHKKPQHRSFSPAGLLPTAAVYPQIFWVFSSVVGTVYFCCLSTPQPGSQLGLQLVISLPSVSGRCIRQGGRDS